MIYTAYLSGQSTPQIAGYLYEKEHKTRSGGRFNSKLVQNILRNPIYIGNIVWNRRHYDPKQKTLNGQKYVKNDASKIVMGKGKHEPIVSKEDFEAVQKKLDQNRKGLAVRKGSKEYPLTGILMCGNCGHKMYGSLGIASREKKKTRAKRRYYRCSGRATYHIDCREPVIRAEDVESEVYTILDVALANRDFDEKRISQIVQLASSAHNQEIEQEIEAVKEKIKENIVK